jgi:hypothetical protein
MRSPSFLNKKNPEITLAYFIHHIVVKYEPESMTLHNGDVMPSENKENHIPTKFLQLH